MLLFSSILYSQTIIENPRIGMSTSGNVKIEKIELRDTATVLWFHVYQTPGAWISVPDQSFIQAVGNDKKLFIKSAEGIKINDLFYMPAAGETRYKLFFPKIDASVSMLDFGEANEGGSWFIYDIALQPELFKSIIPSAISGNWFRSDNALWEISLFDSVAIYKNQVWKYQQYTEKKGIGKLELKNGSKTITLNTKSINDSTLLAGEASGKMAKYAHRPDESVIPADNETYKAPVFKMDTVTYCGYIRGLSKRFPQRTGMVYVNNVLTGEQESHLLKIEDDGSFILKFAYSNPEGILVKLPTAYETVYIEPGKTTFHLIDNNNANPHLFMGDCARLNMDMMKVKNIYSFDYNQMMKKVADATPEQYKSWLQELQQKDLQTVKDFALKHQLSAKALQVKEMTINYRYASDMMSYSMNAQSAWRQNNNIPPDQREVSYKPAKLDSTYYSFLTTELVNNPLAVITSDYYFFINRLMYMELLRNNSFGGFTTSDILAELEKSGLTMTSEEKEMASKMKEIDTPEAKKASEDFNLEYGPQLTAFNRKYREKLNDFYKENKGKITTPAMIQEYLVAQHIELTEEEKALLAAQKKYNEIPQIQKMIEVQKELSEPIKEFYTNRRDFINELFKKKNAIARNEKIQKVLGIQPGLATDIMNSQDICRPIVSEMTPSSDNNILAAQKEINTPFIGSYIAVKNNEVKAKLEANKKLTGAKVNEVPKTEADKVFDAIMEKYKGKVVYVDFWATWCGPCRSGIERIKPLKNEMANENVVFVYISAPSSPKTTYDNMIPTIKGEHYRVSDDEWNILCGKFNISGIPHCVLVGKDGKVINSHLPYMGNDQLKAMLTKHMME
jgi:thiol-disulfide isomerase/thioredoxin